LSRQGNDGRLRLLVDAGISLSSELSLDALLQRLVEVAAELTAARYAALGVVDASGTGLERFLTTGVDHETRAAIGGEPVGRGILGVVIREAEPLRLSDLGADERSVGFPQSHPPMTTFLGVPVVLRDRVCGNLYLTEKAGGLRFTDEDEELTRLLAAQAAVAIENARLHESSTRWLRQLETLNEIGLELASQIDLGPVLEIVAARLGDLIGARVVLIALADRDGVPTIAAAEGAGAQELVGTRLELDASKVGAVMTRVRGERVDSLADDPEVDDELVRRLGFTSGLYVPLVVEGRAIGAIVAHDRAGTDPRFDDEHVRIGESLATRAAVAIDHSRRVSRDGMRRVLEAQEVERARVARELHDETGQALTSILLGLRSLEGTVESQDAHEALASVRELVVSTLHDVRRLAVELRPAALDDFGLEPALERLVTTHRQDESTRIDLAVRLGDERLPNDVETTLYRIAQEALTNTVKHAGATRISVLVTRHDRTAVLVVEDDGRGFDPDAPVSGLGLAGMRERVGLVGGRLKVETAEGSGTTIAAEVPLP
jgi:signal transduction histidine kinase